MTGLRRARPGMGTLVELGVGLRSRAGAAPAWALAALDAGWRAVARVEAAMSAFLPGSDVARFNAAPAGAALEVGAETAAVLRAAAALAARTGGLFDPTCGTGPRGWALRGRVLEKREAGACLDLGGIAKGHAVDRAVAAMAAALRRRGRPVRCWANAGGDLRTCGVAVPVHLRDEDGGGARPWLLLREGAVATSDFAASPGRLAGGAARARRVSVVARRCLDCDALTKVVGLSGDAAHPAVRARGGRAWIHA
jgi:thiamine biosynthesis lipoprotein